jgi:hypothetical protein
MLRADPAPAGPEPKDYTLFMGLNLEIQVGDGYYKLLGVAHNKAVVRVNGQLREVAFFDIKQYEMKLEPKVAGTSASVDHFASDRAYTPANDPKRIWRNRETQVTGYADDQVSNLAAKVSMDAMMNAGKQFSGPGPGASQVPNTSVSAGINQDTAALNQGINNMPSEMSDDSYYERKMQEDLDKKLFDAVDISFEVSSPVELDAPYAVTVTTFREKEDSPESQRWIYIQPLPAIYTQPTKVHFMQGGFPPGFALGKCQVHLYNAGREVPTSVSSGRMALTRTQVLQYAQIQYLVEHKGQTLDPAPMHDSAPARLRDDVDPAQLAQAFHVSIDKEGAVVNVSTSANSGEVSHYTRDIWMRLRFYPALVAGKPVAATIDSRLADFVE